MTYGLRTRAVNAQRDRSVAVDRQAIRDASRKYRWRSRMPERPLSRAALSRENRRPVYEMACDPDHKKITPIVTDADQTVIANGGAV
jgi:hypothetical protein